MRFSVLASGSRGNACYIETDNTNILIDAGLSCRETFRRLDMINVRVDRFDALVITHEHHDHIKGAGPISRKYNIPLLLNRATLRQGIRTLGSISTPITFQTGHSITINDIVIDTFTKCHDAADPMGLIISSNGASLGIITDLGRSTQLITDRLKKCDAILIEFNHDSEMLDEGPYPPYLKRRIKGAEGHLSNQQAGELLMDIAHKGMKQIILAHISEINNLPEKALEAAKKALAEIGMDRISICVSSQDEPSPLIEI